MNRDQQGTEWPAEVLQEQLGREVARVQQLVDWADTAGQLPDHCYAFADGVTVYATGHAPWEEGQGGKGKGGEPGQPWQGGSRD